MACTFRVPAVSASLRSSRPVMATRAPLAARVWAMARPMPLLPPVINATAFCRFILAPEGIQQAHDCTPREASNALSQKTATAGCPPTLQPRPGRGFRTRRRALQMRGAASSAPTKAKTIPGIGGEDELETGGGIDEKKAGLRGARGRASSREHVPKERAGRHCEKSEDSEEVASRGERGGMRVGDGDRPRPIDANGFDDGENGAEKVNARGGSIELPSGDLLNPPINRGENGERRGQRQPQVSGRDVGERAVFQNREAHGRGENKNEARGEEKRGGRAEDRGGRA